MIMWSLVVMGVGMLIISALSAKKYPNASAYAAAMGILIMYMGVSE